MANNNFIVKNGLTVNGSFTANSTAVNAAAITATSITVSGNATINSIFANGSTGLANQVLSSNGTGLYWANVAAGATFVRQTFTANSTVNTTFTITNGYTVNSIDIYNNGVKLINGTEVTATNGTSITLTTPAAVGTIVDVVGLLSASVYSLNINTMSQGFAFSWTNNHIFSANVTVNAAIFTVGNTTANAVINTTTLTIANSTANAIVNTTGFAVGTTLANTVINSTTLTIANSTITAVVNTTGLAVGTITSNAVVNTTGFAVGTSTANAVINTTALTIANSTANAVVNTTGFAVGTSTANAVINTTTLTIANSTANAVVNTTGLVVGNTTANAVVNSTAFTVANSTVTYSYVAPTSAQKANTTFFLNANGSWATAGGTGGANTTITSSNTLTASSLKIVSVSMANVGQSITLPAATTLTTGGPIFALINKSSSIEFGIRDASGTLIAAVGQNGDGECYLEDNSTSAGTWSVRGSNLLPAIRSLEYIFGSTYRATSGYNGGSGSVDIIIRLSDTLSIGIVRSTTGQAYVFAVDHSTSPDTVGTPVLVNASTNTTNPFLYKITATKAALAIGISNLLTLYNVTVSGTTCTVSTGVTGSFGPNDHGRGKINNFGTSRVAVFGTNRDILLFASLYGATNYAQAFDCSGTNPVAGTAVDITYSTYYGSFQYIGELSSTTALSVVYENNNFNQYIYRVLSVSGTTITAGTPVLGGSSDGGGIIFQLTSSGNTFISYRVYNSSGQYSPYYKPFTISGTTITAGSSSVFPSSYSSSTYPVSPYFTSYSNTLFSFNYNDAGSYYWEGVYSSDGTTISNTTLGYITKRWVSAQSYPYRTQALSSNSFLYVTDLQNLSSGYGGNKVLNELNLSGNTYSNGNMYMFPPNAKPVGGFTNFGNNGLTIYRSIDASSINTSTDYSFSAFRYTSSGVRFLALNPITLPKLTSTTSNVELNASYGFTDNQSTSNASNKFVLAGSTSLIGITPANTSYANSELRNTPMINVLEFIV